ncbi:hypothetical protein [Micromonospora sp. WMMD812]|uniref:hypothetical protein n=1 Tax=Micromonospora sp. WMMD812 TaxID=3015152 RepID=UPI00248CF0E8|nr:hypothetical protein [Micromonospora sp. WMMD812]WBB70081.1 hypothetical protein O7603_12250 [Micromonospora sp. WMMD812]
MMAVLLGFEVAGRPLSLPQNRRAVPQTIIPQADVSGPLQFGFEMGTGVRTFMPTALPHALVAAVVLVGGVGPGLAAGLGFGIGRALMPLVRSSHENPADWDDRLLDVLRLVGQLVAVGFLALVVALALHRTW